MDLLEIITKYESIKELDAEDLLVCILYVILLILVFLRNFIFKFCFVLIYNS
ncbi:hypothetical protein T4B_12437 [Trichinella pseudospiralis]|uniref:Uncharacterized protein n=1 Tax=Trichinella pseudospiralis TaxID=6337 RepID=A0A0V1GJK6_TRIPS|nr:hypothetical protein T4B_12437 [Trichinella pseudospiralis]